MKTRWNWLGTAAVLTAISFSSYAQTKWDLPTAYPASNPHTVTLDEFTKDVAQRSGGKLVITLHPNGALFKGNEIKRAVQSGQVQAGEIFMSSLENENALFGLDAQPFVATSYDAAWKLWQAQRPAVEANLTRQGIRLLYALAWPPQGFYAKKPINGMSDLKGLKTRTNNLVTTRLAQAVGSQSQSVQAADLAQALSTGVVDSFMSSSATGVDGKVWENLKYFYTVDAWFPKNMVLINEREFKQLDADTQKTVLEAGAAAESRGWGRMRAYNDESIATLKKNGVTVLPPSAELLSGLKVVGDELKADWVKRAGTEGAAVLSTYEKK